MNETGFIVIILAMAAAYIVAILLMVIAFNKRNAHDDKIRDAKVAELQAAIDETNRKKEAFDGAAKMLEVALKKNFPGIDIEVETGE